MNYEEMSDLQINLLVANATGVDAEENCGVVFASVKHTGDNVVSVIGAVDYCNNPSDAWPIIEAIFWRLMASDELGVTEWARHIRKEDCSDKLRAAMIVFLMMKDAQNV